MPQNSQLPDRGASFIWWLCLCLAIYLITRSFVGDIYHGDKHGPDFGYYWSAAQRLVEDEPLYSLDPPNGYVYTPLVAIVLKSLTAVDYEQVKTLCWLALAGCMVASPLIFALAAGWKGRRVGVLVLLALLMATHFRPTMLNFFWGQVNPPLLLILCLMFLAQRFGAWRTLGCLIALGAFIKTWFIALLLYALLCRQWRSAVACGVALVVGMSAMFSYVGWDEFSGFWRVTTAKSVQPELISESWFGLGRLHLRDNPIMPPLVDSPAAYYLFVLTGVAFFATFAVTLARTWISRLSPEERLLTLSMFASGLVIGLPLAHLAYYILVLPLVWSLLLLAMRRGGWHYIGPAVIAVGCFLGMSMTWRPLSGGTGLPEGVWSIRPQMTTVLGVLLWAVSLVAWFCVYRTHRLNRETSANK